MAIDGQTAGFVGELGQRLSADEAMHGVRLTAHDRTVNWLLFIGFLTVRADELVRTLVSGALLRCV
jgi:hypothetical protein